MTSSFFPKLEDFTSTFLWFSRNTTRAPERKQLPKDFWVQLVKLEAQIQNKEISADTLDVLVQHYTKAVEYYDTKQDGIADYFSYKIQDLLANKKSLNMLLGQNFLKKEEDGDEEVEERVKRNDWEKRKRERDAKQIEKTIESLKAERQRLANFYCNVQTENEKQKEVMSLIVDDYAKCTQDNDLNISRGINKQKDRIKKRLEQKRSQSFAEYAMNTSMASSIDGQSFIQEQIFKNRKDSFNESRIFCDSENFITEPDDEEFEKEILKIGMADEVENLAKLQVAPMRSARRTKSRFMPSRAKFDDEEEQRKEENEEKMSTNDSFTNGGNIVNIVECLETENEEFNVDEAIPEPEAAF